MTQARPVTIAYGDGIGPEIMNATVAILEAAGAAISWEEIRIGESVYREGHSAGIEPSAWESLRRTKVFLKAPITTPQGGGFKSLNVTVRTTLGLYANVRPCVSYHPFIRTRHPKMNLVIVRENEEDLYSGIEHRQTDDVVQCLKLISRPGSERICRYAFEYALQNQRSKVTCFSKDNIMKLTDGLFHRVFNEVAAEYPSIQTDHMIVDIGAARLADSPEMFDVIVMPNLYGDILSDVAAQITGSVGIAGSANIGSSCAMFEAIHGSAPPLAGKNLANPSGLLLGSVMMLVHIGQPQIATRVHNAWLKTIEDGIHTPDIYSDGCSQQQVGTKQFAQAVIERLGQVPQRLRAANYPEEPPRNIASFESSERVPPRKELVGVDVFFDWRAGRADALAAELKKLDFPELKLTLITNRGVKVWPDGVPETECVDHWRCRFQAPDAGQPIARSTIPRLLAQLDKQGLDFIKTEGLYTFDGELGYSLAQGE